VNTPNYLQPIKRSPTQALNSVRNGPGTPGHGRGPSKSLGQPLKFSPGQRNLRTAGFSSDRRPSKVRWSFAKVGARLQAVKGWPGGMWEGGGLPKIEVLFEMEVRIGLKDFTK